jgi:hypothetical protein
VREEPRIGDYHQIVAKDGAKQAKIAQLQEKEFRAI